MPEWLKGMVGPTLMLWLCAIAFGISHCLASEGETSKRADLVFRFALPLVIASWVSADARKRNRAQCYDYDSFIFFVPCLAPVYLFQTRGVRAFITLLAFAGIWMIGMAPALIVSFVRGFTQ